MGVMDDKGNIDLKDMMEKINKFLSEADNKKKFLKDFDDDVKPNVEVKNVKIKAKDLKPSQDAIFLDHILSRLVVNDYDREQILGGNFKDHDILISEDDHIIDGHHRWAAAYLLNPNCKIDCTKVRLPIEYALPLINSILEASDKITLGRTGDYKVNIFDLKDWKKQKLMKKMNTVISKTIKSGVDLGAEKNLKSEEAWKEEKTNKSLIDINTDAGKYFYKNIKKKLDLKKHPLKYMRKNLKKMPTPEEIFGPREEMPHIKEKDAKKYL
jgi:hypothetical protein